MDIKSVSLEQARQVFWTLGDVSRLRIYKLLFRQHFLITDDLIKILGYSQTTINRHLQYLKNAGLVEIKRVKYYSVYSVKPVYRNFLLSFLLAIEDEQFKKDEETYNSMFDKKELKINKISDQLEWVTGKVI